MVFVYGLCQGAPSSFSMARIQKLEAEPNASRGLGRLRCHGEKHDGKMVSTQH